MKNHTAVSLVANRPEEWTYLPPLVLLLLVTYVRRVGIHVARATRNTGFVVALQTYVLHFGSVYGPTVACGGPVHESE
jgi:hypothetical protein